MSWIEKIRQMDLLAQGGFVVITGLLTVFLVLALFYFSIKIIAGRSKVD